MPLTTDLSMGYVMPAYDEILAALQNKAKEKFGGDLDVSDTSTAGKILVLWADSLYTEEQKQENIYLSNFLPTAEGVSLDRYATRFGISRNPASYAEYSITLNGTPGAVVPIGFLVSAYNGDVIFHTVDEYTIGEDGTVTAIITANQAGTAGNVPAAAITEIVNPSADVTGVSDAAVLYMGADTETDYQFRQRLYASRSGSGSGTARAIQTAVMRISGVEGAYIEENDTDTPTAEIAAHSFIVYAQAARSLGQQIAEAIYSAKAAGIMTSGTESYTVLDDGGGEHEIRFSFTSAKDVYISVTILINNNFPENGIETIKQGIVEKVAMLTNGQPLTATSLYAPIYNAQIDGVLDVTNLKLSTDGVTYSDNTITAADSEVIRTIAQNITITTTAS